MNLSDINLSFIPSSLFVPVIAVGGTALLIEATSRVAKQFFKNYKLLKYGDDVRTTFSYFITVIAAGAVACGLGAAGIVPTTSALMTVVASSISLYVINVINSHFFSNKRIDFNSSGLFPQNAQPQPQPQPANHEFRNEPEAVRQGNNLATDAPSVSQDAEDLLRKGKKWLYRNQVKARSYFEAAARQGSAKAYFLLAENFRIFYSANEPQKLALYEESARQNYVPALREVARQYHHKHDATPEQKEIALQYFTRVAELNKLDVHELSYLADIHAERNDLVQALKYHKQAIELFRVTDDFYEKDFRVRALEKLIQQYENGYFHAETNAAEELSKLYKEVFDFYKKTADKNKVAWAQYKVGTCYYHGRGVPINQSEGVRYWYLAADQKYSSAHTRLAEYFEKEKEYQTAYEHFKKAAKFSHFEEFELSQFKERMKQIGFSLID